MFVAFVQRKSYTRCCLRPLTMPLWPVLTVCDEGQGWHSPTGSRTQQVRSPLDVLIHGHGQPRFAAYFTPRRTILSTTQVSVRVDSCQKRKKKKKRRKKKKRPARTFDFGRRNVTRNREAIEAKTTDFKHPKNKKNMNCEEKFASHTKSWTISVRVDSCQKRKKKKKRRKKKKRPAQTFDFGRRNVTRNREAIKVKKTDFKHPKNKRKS